MSSYSERMWTSLGYRGGAPGPDDVLGLSFREIVNLPQCVSPPPRAPVLMTSIRASRHLGTPVL